MLCGEITDFYKASWQPKQQQFVALGYFWPIRHTFLFVSCKYCWVFCVPDLSRLGATALLCPPPRRFTKRLHGLRNLSYCDRLTKLGLCTLEQRRLHLDLLYCYKIVFGLVNVNFDNFFALSTNTNTRGHKYKLFKPRCTASIRQKFFLIE